MPLAFLLSLLLLMLPNTSQAHNGCLEQSFYMNVFGGGNLLALDKIGSFESDSKLGFFLGMSMGDQSCPPWRIEEELTYRRNEMGRFKISGNSYSSNLTSTSYSLMVNGYYDFLQYYTCKHYIGFGMGVTYFHVQASVAGTETSASDYNVAFQWILGMSRPVPICIGSFHTMALEYRLHYVFKDAIDNAFCVNFTRNF